MQYCLFSRICVFFSLGHYCGWSRDKNRTLVKLMVVKALLKVNMPLSVNVAARKPRLKTMYCHVIVYFSTCAYARKSKMLLVVENNGRIGTFCSCNEQKLKYFQWHLCTIVILSILKQIQCFFNYITKSHVLTKQVQWSNKITRIFLSIDKNSTKESGD